MTLTDQIIKTADCVVGASLGDIKKAVGRTDNALGVLVSDLAKRGRMYVAGPHMRKRYFTDETHAEAYEQRMEADSERHAAEVEQRRKERLERRNKVRREEAAAKRAAMPPKPKKVPEKTPFKQSFMVKKSVPSTVQIKPTKAAPQIVIPPHVKVQQCPSAWKDKPLPPKDAIVNRRADSEQWRECGRMVF